MDNAKAPGTRAPPTTGEYPIMPREKFLSLMKAPEHPAGRSSYLVAHLAKRKKGRATDAERLKMQAEILNWLSTQDNGTRRISKAEVQGFFEHVKPVPFPADALNRMAIWQKSGGKISNTVHFLHSVGSSLDIMPMSGALNNPWGRDHAALKDDAARIAENAWVVITRHDHDRR